MKGAGGSYRVLGFPQIRPPRPVVVDVVGFPPGDVSERGDIRHRDASINLDEGDKKVAMVGSGSSLRAGFSRFFLEPGRGSDRRWPDLIEILIS